MLVLSEFAGAAEQLGAALLVNPHDADAMVDTLQRAVAMDRPEMHRRMRSLRRIVRNHDVYAWADTCLRAIAD